MIIQTVKFKSALSEVEIQRVMEERAGTFCTIERVASHYHQQGCPGARPR